MSMTENHYRLGAKRFSSESKDLHEILANAHKARERPVCLCSNTFPEMYVAQVNQNFILKRMPGTGHLHDPSCSTFDPPPELSGLGQVNGSAISVDDDGLTSLKLDFPLSVRGKRGTPPTPSESETSSAIAPPKKLTLIGMLHYL